MAITLNAILPADMLDKLEQILNDSCAMIELGSGHTLSVSPEVSVITLSKDKPRPAITIWFSGKSESNLASFRAASADEFRLDEKVNRVLFNIVSPFLRERTELTPLAELNNEINADEALAYLITRHSWYRFGTLLQKESDTE